MHLVSMQQAWIHSSKLFLHYLFLLFLLFLELWGGGSTISISRFALKSPVACSHRLVFVARIMYCFLALSMLSMTAYHLLSNPHPPEQVLSSLWDASISPKSFSYIVTWLFGTWIWVTNPYKLQSPNTHCRKGKFLTQISAHRASI